MLGFLTLAEFACSVKDVSRITDTPVAWHQVLTGSMHADIWIDETLVDIWNKPGQYNE